MTPDQLKILKNPPPMWEKQEDALNFALDRGDEGAGLLLEMGTGKSRITIETACILYDEHPEINLGYICAPISVMHNWIDEWALWGWHPVIFIDLAVERLEGLKKAINLSNAGFKVICLFNYELAWQFGMKYITRTKRDGTVVKKHKQIHTKLCDIEWDFGILDEITKIKTPGGKIGRFFRTHMRPVTRYRYGLTGSAYTKRPLDVWAIIKFLTGDTVYPKAFEVFQDEFSIPHPFIQFAHKGYKNIDKLVEYLNACCILLKKEEVLDLLTPTHNKHYVDLSPAHKKMYEQFKKDAYIELELLEEELAKENKTVTAFHVFAKMIRLRQITSGFVGADDKSIVELGSTKLPELLEILDNRPDDAHTLIVVQHDWEEEYLSREIFKAFKVKPLVLNGSIIGGAKRTQMIKDASQEPYFIVKESVACRGIDGRAFDMTIFYSHSERTEEYDQMLARNHRGGQTKPITYKHLITRNTIDEKIVKTLEGDLAQAKALEDDWRALFDD